MLRAPAMGDRRFVESLLLMVHHDEAGAVGFVVNHPVSNLSFYDLLDQLDLKNPKGVSNHVVFHGGPIQSNSGFVIYRGAMDLQDEQHVNHKIYYSRSVEILRRIAQGKGPDHYLICLGRAEWGPGQLEQELTENVWLPSPADPDLVFGEKPELVWSEALHAQGISSVNFTNVAGHA